MEWKIAHGFDKYEVSDAGQIRNRKTGRILKSQPMDNDYLKVWLMNGGRRGIPVYVHQLVLQTFGPPQPEGFEASHKNGNRQDNSASNLVWEDRWTNNRRRIEHGTWGQRLTEDDVREIRRAYAARELNQYQLAERYGVSQCEIHNIVSGKHWRHVA
jgi:hypothetical protein